MPDDRNGAEMKERICTAFLKSFTVNSPYITKRLLKTSDFLSKRQRVSGCPDALPRRNAHCWRSWRNGAAQTTGWSRSGRGMTATATATDCDQRAFNKRCLNSFKFHNFSFFRWIQIWWLWPLFVMSVVRARSATWMTGAADHRSSPRDSSLRRRKSERWSGPNQGVL